MRNLKVQTLFLFFALPCLAGASGGSHGSGPVLGAIGNASGYESGGSFNIKLSNQNKCVSAITQLRKEELRTASGGAVTLGVLGTYFSTKNRLQQKIAEAAAELKMMKNSSIQVSSEKAKVQSASRAVQRGVGVDPSKLVAKLRALEALEKELEALLGRSGLKSLPTSTAELGALRAESQTLTALIDALDRKAETGRSIVSNLSQGIHDNLSRVSEVLERLGSAMSVRQAALGAGASAASRRGLGLRAVQVAGRGIPVIAAVATAMDAKSLYDGALDKIEEVVLANDPAAVNLRDERIFNARVNPFEICRALMGTNKQAILERKLNFVFNALALKTTDPVMPSQDPLPQEEDAANGSTPGVS